MLLEDTVDGLPEVKIKFWNQSVFITATSWIHFHINSGMLSDAHQGFNVLLRLASISEVFLKTGKSDSQQVEAS